MRSEDAEYNLYHNVLKNLVFEHKGLIDYSNDQKCLNAVFKTERNFCQFLESMLLISQDSSLTYDIIVPDPFDVYREDYIKRVKIFPSAVTKKNNAIFVLKYYIDVKESGHATYLVKTNKGQLLPYQIERVRGWMEHVAYFENANEIIGILNIFHSAFPNKHAIASIKYTYS